MVKKGSKRKPKEPAPSKPVANTVQAPGRDPSRSPR